MQIMSMREVPLNYVKIKDRFRIDLGDISGLADAIKAKGLLQPITLDMKGNLIAGERRFRAHEELGKDTIWAIEREIHGKIDALEIELMENVCRKDLNWPERARLERRIFDLYEDKDKSWSIPKQAQMYVNEGRERGNSESAIGRRLELAEALTLLPELSDYPDEGTAYKALSKLKESEAIKAMVGGTPKYISEAPKWAKDHYRIGDAFEGMEKLVANQIHSKGEGFHFAEVDPPYGVNLHKRKGRNTDRGLMEEYEEWENYPRLFETTAKLVYECLQPHAFAIFWYGMSWHCETLQILRRVGFGVPDIPAIWNKGEVGQTASPDTTFGSCYEPFFVARKGQPKLVRAGRGNVFSYPGITGKKVHPTEKPIYLMEEICNVFLFPNSRILVPFLGSGVTLRAAYRKGHTGIGWDLSGQHKEGFLKRVAEDIEASHAAAEPE